MGRTYLFECTNCDYRALVAGGFAEGLDFTVQTIHCLECRDLQDAVTAQRLPPETKINPDKQAPPSFNDLVRRLPRMGQIWANYNLACFLDPTHPVRVWNEPDRCPRCSAFMEPGKIPFRQWD